MNKYLKILALSVGIIGSATPLAINNDNDVKADLNNMYESVGKLDLFTNLNESANRLNNLSKIKYNLTINPTDSDVKFVSATDEGEQELSDEETISYLTENLNEVFSEYDSLKTCLSNAIKDTMDYLDKCNNSEDELTNEQKVSIKERANTIKYLAETLEDLSEDIMCCIDGCENDEDLDAMVGKYISAINSLEERIISLQNAINALQQPLSIPHRLYPNHIYGFRYNIYPDIDDELSQNNSNESFNQDNNSTNQDNENSLNNDNQLNIGNINNQDNSTEDSGVENNIGNQDNYGESAIDNQDEINNIINENNQNEDNTTQSDDEDNLIDDEVVDTNQESTNNQSSEEVGENVENEKPTTFGLKSNIDTYGPGPNRNIDTFFNTALLDDQYGYGYNHGGYGGYGMPYGHGYPNGYGYYGGNMYGSMNGYGYNSNSINRAALEREVNAPIEVENNETGENNQDNINRQDKNQNKSNKKIKENNTPNKIKKNRAKNIDTYNQTTIQSNINSMGESKISKFFKEKFNNLRDKVRNRKQNDTPELQKQVTENHQNERVDEIANNDLVSPNVLDNSNSLLDNSASENSTTQTSLINPEDSKLQEIEDLENSTKDFNNQINPDLNGEFKVEKIEEPNARK